MPNPLTALLRYLRSVDRMRDGADQSDSELLQMFVTERSEAAFAALLRRHGPLVFSVCQRVLRDPADAEDAFQATFLVLARKARSVRNHDALAAWLYRVALNICRTTRLADARRQAHERQAVLMAQTGPVDQVEVRDWLPVLHEVVDRLPEKYRVPVILCYFQGMTHEEAAERLRWPLGSVKGRLARARDLVRARLARRGLALSTAGTVSALADCVTAAMVPPQLIGSTLQAVAPFATGKAVSTAASAKAITLAQTAIGTMTRTKLIQALILSLMVGMGGVVLAALGRTFADRSSTAEEAAERPTQEDSKTPAVPLKETSGVRSGTFPVPKVDEDGPEVKGLRARIKLGANKFAVGDPIPVVYVVRNVSKFEQVIWHSGFWPNHLIIVKDADGKEPLPTEFGKQCRQAFSPGGPRDKNVPVKVPAGGEDGAYEKYDLTKLYDLAKPGRYTVQYLYEEKQGGWEGRLPSNEAPFEIVARDMKDIGVNESKPVRVGGLEFVTLAPKRVHAPKVGATSDFDLGLRVTNVTDKPIALRSFDVIRPQLYAVSGKRVARVGLDMGRDGTPKPTPPAMLEPGASWTWEPKATLSWSNDRAALRLSGPDGRGVPGFWMFGPLSITEGFLGFRYRLAVEYANDSAKQGDVALWTGKATTAEVEFEILKASE
jgi:RNA polymerase sigma factor (sigma-70 family)